MITSLSVLGQRYNLGLCVLHEHGLSCYPIHIARAQTSLKSLNLAAAAAGATAGQAPSAASGQNPQHPAPDTSRGSPTEMLRMLLPSACKPRHSHYSHHHHHHAPSRPSAAAEQAPPPAAEVAQAREENSYAAQWLGSAVQAEAPEQPQEQKGALGPAAGTDEVAGALPQRGLAFGSPRISMDNLDQDETGELRLQCRRKLSVAKAWH